MTPYGSPNPLVGAEGCRTRKVERNDTGRVCVVKMDDAVIPGSPVPDAGNTGSFTAVGFSGFIVVHVKPGRN